MKDWQSIGFGAIETSHDKKYGNGGPLAYVVLPIWPSPPLILDQAASNLWARGLYQTVVAKDLDLPAATMSSEFIDMGIACANTTTTKLNVARPVMESVEHEIVYALVASLCAQYDIEYVFIKGPIQFEYGLRERKHSADVDVWINPRKIQEFISAMDAWGWYADTERWVHSHFNHSVTLNASTWGCQIDVHRYFPGSSSTPTDAFATAMAWRDSVIYAGVKVSVLSKPAASVLYALHGLRPESRHRKKTMTVSEAAIALRIGGQEAAQFCREFASTAVLLEALTKAFPDEKFDRSSVVPSDWKWRNEADWAKAYFMIVRSMSIHEWPNFLRDVLRKPRSSGSDRKAGISGVSRIAYRLKNRRLDPKSVFGRYFLRKR